MLGTMTNILSNLGASNLGMWTVILAVFPSLGTFGPKSETSERW